MNFRQKLISQYGHSPFFDPSTQPQFLNKYNKSQSMRLYINKRKKSYRVKLSTPYFYKRIQFDNILNP